MRDRFNNIDRPIELPNEYHCCLTLIIDVSGSMEPHLPHVDASVNRMIQELRQDARLAKIVDMSIITFSDRGQHKLVQPFDSISRLPEVKLSLGGSTYAVDALEMARANTSRQKFRYDSGCFKPWLVFITDGNIFDDLSEIGAKLRQDDADGKYHVLCFGVGAGYEKKQLFMLSDKCFQILNYNFSEFFSWIGRSQAALSVSVPGSNVGISLSSSVKQLSITA
ncbi:MAG: VWA domain-containing protein [Clostridiales bacterium]|jgi:uncharacterized protein YegL|nr:VWA domain-containing protein [Clostridiales bacterium]MDR2752096.1 VWA domain-containing protein [Clostridiales bacterium]